MAEIIVENLFKSFGATQVVKGINLTVADGEFMVFVGPSGCGKSTTLRMIAGLETVSAGSIHIADKNVTRLQPKDRNVAMVFQNYALYAHKNVYDNLAFGLKVRGTPKADIEQRVKSAAATLGIAELLERKPKQLSGGQMQRVALGRALVRNPDVFLLDEPLSNLDAKMRVRMREEIAKLHRNTGTSMIYVTHDQIEAMTLGDRIAVMNDGIIQQIGAPLDIYDFPANLFVANFIGSPEMNFLQGSIVNNSSSKTFFFKTAAISIPLSNSQHQNIENNRSVVLGVRPEHLQLTTDNKDSIGAEISLVEQMGAQTFVVCSIGENTLRCLVERNDQLHIGMNIQLQIKQQDRIHLFDLESGTAI